MAVWIERDVYRSIVEGFLFGFGHSNDDSVLAMITAIAFSSPSFACFTKIAIFLICNILDKIFVIGWFGICFC